MADTGQRHEITRLANAKEAETIHDQKKLASKAKQNAEKAALQDRFRNGPKAHADKAAKPVETPAKTQREDREASEKMVDEGDPNKKP
jgi:hypothetical protein